MKRCLTKEQMQKMENYTIEQIGIPSLVLMERAALSVVQFIEKNVKWNDKISIVCGMGNNGADGIAIARILFQKNYDVKVVTVGNMEKSTEEYKTQYKIAQNLTVPIIHHSKWTPTKEQWIVDGIFGIGLSRNVEGEYGELIEKINKSGCEQMIAIDIPSGICATTGKVLGCGIYAKYTVTFGYEKVGLYLGTGKIHAGEVIVADIGFPKESLAKIEDITCRLEEYDLINIPSRQNNANKGTYGRLLIVAGSVGMNGAAYLCALAACRTGAGLVKILTVEENREMMQMQLPEAIVATYKEDNLKEVVKTECGWATTMVMGPGLGQKPYVYELIKTVLQCSQVPMVLDSDALNTIAKYPELLSYVQNRTIMTPHMKEMSRLTGLSMDELKSDSVRCAKEYARKQNVVCLMKDATSVIVHASGKSFINISGNSSLAKAGTGDVLAGIVGGLLCLGMNQYDSAIYGSFLHGRSGVKSSQKQGTHGVLASDLTNHIW